MPDTSTILEVRQEIMRRLGEAQKGEVKLVKLLKMGQFAALPDDDRLDGRLELVMMGRSVRVAALEPPTANGHAPGAAGGYPPGAPGRNPPGGPLPADACAAAATSPTLTAKGHVAEDPAGEQPACADELGDLNIAIYIDQDLGIKSDMVVKGGTTILGLKDRGRLKGWARRIGLCVCVCVCLCVFVCVCVCMPFVDSPLA